MDIIVSSYFLLFWLMYQLVKPINKFLPPTSQKPGEEIISPGIVSSLKRETYITNARKHCSKDWKIATFHFT